MFFFSLNSPYLISFIEMGSLRHMCGKKECKADGSGMVKTKKGTILWFGYVEIMNEEV